MSPTPQRVGSYAIVQQDPCSAHARCMFSDLEGSLCWIIFGTVDQFLVIGTGPLMRPGVSQSLLDTQIVSIL
jgi:hypothetical protein